MAANPRLMLLIRNFGERTVYRAGGLPLLVASWFATTTDPIQTAYLSQFWDFESPTDPVTLLALAVAWPIAIALTAFWFTRRNGKLVAASFGRSRWRQFTDQLSLAAKRGILPPWYYVFELYREENRGRAANYLNRFETKQGLYPLLRHARTRDGNRERTRLGDKVRFEAHCRIHQIATPPILFAARDGEITTFGSHRPPDHDLFLKPLRGRGGKGAERWNLVGPDRYENSLAGERDFEGLLEHLQRLSKFRPYIVQPRLTNHPALADLNNGALSTIRVVSWLNEQDLPEITNAVFRMAVGNNRTVDNIHAGGIAAAVDVETGVLGQATNLGADAALGWLDRHPSSGAPITGRQLPGWPEVLNLVRRVHMAFADHLVIGWDIAVTQSGPVVVEGNGAPCVDLIQRPERRPLRTTRFGELAAFHSRLALGTPG